MKRALFCVGLGAGLMYLFDPQNGSDRRSSLRDLLRGKLPQTSEAVHAKADQLAAKADDLTHKVDEVAADVIAHAGTKADETADNAVDKLDEAEAKLDEKAADTTV